MIEQLRTELIKYKERVKSDLDFAKRDGDTLKT